MCGMLFNNCLAKSFGDFTVVDFSGQLSSPQFGLVADAGIRNAIFTPSTLINKTDVCAFVSI